MPEARATGFVRLLAWLALRLAGVIVGLLAVFGVAAVAGTFWLMPGDPPDRSGADRTVFILSNGYHTDIAIPVVDGEPPDGFPIKAGDLPRGLAEVQFVAVGWGSKAAYTSLVAITDLSVATAVRALSFDRSVIHVLPLYGVPYGEGAYPVRLDDSQYDRLLAFMAATLETGRNGEARLIPGITQGYGDVFYDARPRFSAFYGCNAWTGEALRTAGISVGIWTPFAQSVEWALSY